MCKLVITYTSGDSHEIPVANSVAGRNVVTTLRLTVTTIKSFYIADANGVVLASGEF
jgi:hypothetical protein